MAVDKKGRRGKGLLDSKKGIIFTLLTMAFAIMFISFFVMFTSPGLEKEREVVDTRVKSLDSQITIFEDYISSATEVASYHALDGLSEYIIKNESLLSGEEQFKELFKDCVFNGTILAGDKFCMNSSRRLPYVVEKYQNMTEDNMNVNLTYTVHSLELNSTNAFTVGVEINYSYTLTEEISKPTASWSRDREEDISFSISGLKDPFFGVKTKEMEWPKNRTVVVKNLAPWNKSKLRLVLNNSYYRTYEGSPSYLQRFYNGEGSSDCCGIETYLNSTEAGSLRINHLENRSFASPSILNKEIYDCQTEIRGIKNFYDEDFRLNINRLNRFGIDRSNWTSSC